VRENTAQCEELMSVQYHTPASSDNPSSVPPASIDNPSSGLDDSICSNLSTENMVRGDDDSDMYGEKDHYRKLLNL
jgi:hypothetical protein